MVRMHDLCAHDVGAHLRVRDTRNNDKFNDTAMQQYLRGTVGCGRLALDAETWGVGAET